MHLDDDGAMLKNYEQKTYHYPQPEKTSRRELPMVGASPSFASCADGALDDC
jgi:lysine 2,3-aminomutase